jgi:hypothetical protein
MDILVRWREPQLTFTARLDLFAHRTLCVHGSGYRLLIRSSGNLVGFCCRRSLEKIKISLRVGELLNLLELQASVVVGSGVCDEDHFSIHLHPDGGIRPAGEL